MNTPNTLSDIGISVQSTYVGGFDDFIPDENSYNKDSIVIGDELVFMPYFLSRRKFEKSWIIYKIKDKSVIAKQGNESGIWTEIGKQDLEHYTLREKVLEKYPEYLV